ncbi:MULTISPECIES: hypothetical protein [Lactiplantibacillus]|uniref:hypothetical protein n=1 Tax=Lactiplantibacillus TaxID=2767842 RepID=UPI001C1F2C08|nr:MULTISPECIES: hypothetical protein [Lactiplantibacillus]MBU7448924.1 hypothetical protein [Lactiplantibacillus sp. 7.2.4]MBU7482118.1 hypothetical protein [Lactiplantibacillus pentosus]
MIEKNLVIPEQSAQQKLVQLVNPKWQALLSMAVERGYDMAYTTLHGADSVATWMLEGRGPVAVESRIKQIAVEICICRLIESGTLPFDYHYTYNDAGNHKYLLVSNDSFHLTVNQCHNGNKPAKKVQYRAKENTNFQTRLVFDKDDMIEDDPVSEYLELDHGYKSITPKFVCLGIPDVETDGWQARIDLSRGLSVLSNDSFNTKASGPATITPDEFASYLKRESND